MLHVKTTKHLYQEPRPILSKQVLEKGFFGSKIGILFGLLLVYMSRELQKQIKASFSTFAAIRYSIHISSAK